ncbi:hypothetical protein NKI86_03100 [Mesorhizobium sp. M0320]|uniref:DNA sulfur modification protein DndB n=1 Tax=unclassified Mesorhizobium TaxID=325217 RepID=UPI0033392974
MALRLRQETALDLTLEGTVGSFRVGSVTGGSRSLEVKYLLTHVGLNFSSSTNDKLLSALAPVREIFDFQSLDFDEIMQRDIDDARVSAELVPYLLDEQSKDMIKLFPPIVIVVMPIQEGRTQPEKYYPKVTHETLPPDPSREWPLLVTRSGAVGGEVFQFEQPMEGDLPVMHDLVRLRLNTHRTRLVIVDGQHRAMALLAIYRNLKDQWSDERRAPFKEYYSAWTKTYIERFNLNEINLPVILCTIPELDTAYGGDFDMKKAARTIFLTLNKTARQVSDARNKLLDDNDLISFLMRRTLSHIKEKDERSPQALRIVNVELDQDGSRQKIQTPVAITGVPHVYYMIEHMMLDNGGTVKGVKPRTGTFYNRTRLDDLLARLDGRNLLGAATADTMRRDLFTTAAADKLGRQFDTRYGSYIIGALERFAPFDRHNRAVIEIGEQLEREHDRQLKPILLEGQGIGRVFDAHRINLRQKLRSGYFKTDVPEIEASSRRLEATAARIADMVTRLNGERAQRLLGDISDKKPIRDDDGKIHPKMLEWCNRLYDEIFGTVAFQAALVCGFIGLVEKAERKLQKGDFGEQPPIDRDQAFDEYISQLNQFFVPRSIPQLKKVMRVFTGEIADDKELWAIRPSNQTFRSVVYRAEMQPDQWPKYRYVLLEIWRPTHPALQQVVADERGECRGEVFSALHDHYETTYCRENAKLKDELVKQERNEIFAQAFEPYNGLLRNLGADPLERKAMREAVSKVPAAAATDPDVEEGLEEAEEV